MRGMRFAASIAMLGSALLAACAAGTSAPEIALHDDIFRPYREYSAGRRVVYGYRNILAAELIARVDRKSGAATTLVRVRFEYWGGRMRRYESARSAQAEALALETLSRNRSCGDGDCHYQDLLSVEIPQDELRRAAADGYRLKVFARNGDGATITIAKADIDQLLATLDKIAPQAAAPTN